MQLYKRPKKPSTFSNEVAPLKAAVARLIKRLQEKEKKKKKKGASSTPLKASSKKTGGKKGGKAKPRKEAIPFTDAWKKYKEVFASTQFYKCGFCESVITKTGYGDVEHYRPKGEVWGRPAPGVRKRSKKEVLSLYGYWWLAYDWSNYLFACALCNQKFKGSFFPVKDDPRRLPPGQRTNELPLLLNPYDEGADPAKHLEFRPEGLVLARGGSLHGTETIITCGLNRKRLVKERGKKAKRAYRLASKLRKRSNRRDEELLEDCYNMGRDDEEHSGMARLIFKEVAGFEWGEVVEMCALALCRLRRDADDKADADELDESIERMGRERFEHSAAVRDIYQRTCREVWEKLLERRARQMATDLKRERPIYVGLLYTEFYEMAYDNPSSAPTVKRIFEDECGISWESLLIEIKDLDTL